MKLLERKLPYDSDSLAMFSRLRPLGKGLFLDSGDGYPDHLDVLTAQPEHCLELDNNETNLDTVLHAARRELARWPIRSPCSYPAPGWYGVWSYGLGALTEGISLKPMQLPRLWLGFYSAVIVVDHRVCETRLLWLPGSELTANRLAESYLGADAERSEFSLKSAFSSNLSASEYQTLFSKVQSYIYSGDCYQVNLTQEFKAEYCGCPWSAYRKLRAAVSSPMSGFLEVEGWSLLCLSPERFLQLTKNKVKTKPIKGTRPRSLDPDADQLQSIELQSSAKDRAENLMIVDLLRNDLGRTCETGTVKVDKLFEVESFSNVHHLVSTISGKLDSSLDGLDLLSRAFPGGSITGAPKHRAMEIIDELEPHSREFYCGSLLYIDVCGRMDSNILIRSLVASGGVIRCWGGGGVVADSTATAEYQEIQDKIGFILKNLS